MREAWVDTTLGEVVKIYGGVSPANVAIVPEGGIPFVKVEELNTCAADTPRYVGNRSYLTG